MTFDLGRALVGAGAELTTPLVVCAEDLTALASLVTLTGWDFGPAGLDLQDLAVAAATLGRNVSTIKGQLSGELGLAEIAAIAASLGESMAAVSQFAGAWTPPSGLPSDTPSTFASDLSGQLLLLYLAGRQPVLRSSLELCGVLEYAAEPALTAANGKIVRRAMTRPRLNLEQFGRMIRDPAAGLVHAFHFDEASGWTADQIAEVLFPAAADLLRRLGIVAWYGNLGRLPVAMDPPVVELSQRSLRVVGAIHPSGSGSEVAFEAAAHLRDDGGHRVLTLVPAGEFGIGWTGSGWSLGAALEGSPGALEVRRDGVDFSGATTRLRVDANGNYTGTAAAPMLRLGSQGPAVTLDSASFAITLVLTPQGPSIEATFAVAGLGLEASAGTDGFLAASLPPSIGAAVDLSGSWDQHHGLRVTGGAGGHITIEMERRAGPITIRNLTITLSSQVPADGINVRAGLSVGVDIGPFHAEIEGVGVQATIQPTRLGGNLGPLSVGVGLAPPLGIGLSISSEAVNGGGFLRFDTEAGRYAGVFELTILKTVSVKAIAIITTKMPDGSEGFAILILITAQGFTPIQLGMGFSLTGIGGLIALNRTVDADAVRGGLRDGILDSVLFVKDPVKNADRVLTTLDKVFPIARDRLVVGPLAEISWGTPAIVHLRLALLLDLPMPIRAVVLAALSVMLPKPEAPVVEIHVDAIGVLDLAKGQLALDASLHDSRILSFTLTGDMALRLDWGAQPGFLLSVGGFHPRFTAPPGLRPLNRLALQLTNSTNPLVRFEAYLAITSNTLQLGARAMVKLEVGGFGVEGGGSFDTLVQWSPFHLEVDVAAWVKITAGGATILSLNLALSVTGPAPWHLTGTAEFHLLFISVSVHVDLTLGQSSTAAAAVDAVDVTDLIWQELSAPASWQAVLPPDAVPGVVIAAAGSDADRVLAHPLAVVSVRQKVAPLGVAVTHVGAHLTKQGPATHNLSVLAADGTNATPVTDLFARAQFTDVPAEQRLSAPSFESFDSGVMLAPAAAASSGPGLSFPAVVDTLDLTSFDIPATLSRPAPAVAGSSTGGGQ